MEIEEITGTPSVTPLPTESITPTATPSATMTPSLTPTASVTQIPTPYQFGANLGWNPPPMGDLLTFLIRFFFVVAGLLALFQMLMGALSWISSGGEKGNVEKARNKIVAAVVGVILIVIVLSIAVTLERVVFKCVICLGLTCPLQIPSIIQPETPLVSCPIGLF